MGFSAGGHLTATAGTHFDAGQADASDPIDRVSCRPDFLVLAYPVISFDPAIAHGGSVRNLLGENPDPKLIEDLSNDLRVTPQTPPTFLFHTNADTGVVAENSVRFYLALRRNKVPAELHIFENGPHGVGLALGNPALSEWPVLLTNWLRGRGFADSSSALCMLRSASSVARTTFTGFVPPIDFDRMSRMPAAVTTARTEPPAMTPVPCDAGLSITLLAPYC